MEFEVKPTELVSEIARISKDIQFGAGSNQFRVNKDGVFVGADNYADAPFKISYAGVCTLSSAILTGGTISYGKTSFTDSTNAGYYISNSGFYMGSASDAKYIKYDISAGTITIRGSLNADDLTAGTITGRTLRTAAPAASVGRSVVITGGSNQDISFYYDATLQSYIGGYKDQQGDGEYEYLRLYATSGRRVSFYESMIEVNGNLNPSIDDEFNLGTSGQRWANVYCNNLVEGDSVYSDEYCPICEKGFNEGDVIVGYAYKKTKDGTHTVPMHFDCVKDVKSKDVQEARAFIESQSVARKAARKSEREANKDRSMPTTDL